MDLEGSILDNRALVGQNSACLTQTGEAEGNLPGEGRQSRRLSAHQPADPLRGEQWRRQNGLDQGHLELRRPQITSFELMAVPTEDLPLVFRVVTYPQAVRTCERHSLTVSATL